MVCQIDLACMPDLDLPKWFAKSIWQNEFNLMIRQFGSQFDLAKRIQFQLDISIWQFDLAF
jgi:hypothetical protein